MRGNPEPRVPRRAGPATARGGMGRGRRWLWCAVVALMFAALTDAAGSAAATGATVPWAAQATASNDDVPACPGNGDPTYIANGTNPCVKTTATYADQATYDPSVACAKDDKLPLLASPGQSVGCTETTSVTTTVSISDSFETPLGTVDLSLSKEWKYSVGDSASATVPKDWKTYGKAGWQVIRHTYNVTQSEVECTTWDREQNGNVYYCAYASLKTLTTKHFKAFKPFGLHVVALHAGPLATQPTPHAIPGPSATANGTFENAFQAAGETTMWTSEPVGTGGDWGAGMASGTSPSITAVPGGYEVALQTNTNDLWLLGTDGDIDTHLGMMPGTSPSITALYNGGFEVAFQANTSHLWTYGSAGEKDWGAGMDPASSPSITWNGGSGYEVAIQTNTHDLWQLGTYSDYDYNLGMQPGTSPSITVTSGDGIEIAFQANTTNLWTVGDLGMKDWGAGMDPASSPSITVAAGGYEVALQTNTHDLWTLGTDGYTDWQLGMMPGSSPAIGSVSSGGAGFEIAFRANTGNLWNAGADGTGGNVFGIQAGTNPAITSV